jgi:hypothetical protein
MSAFFLRQLLRAVFDGFWFLYGLKSHNTLMALALRYLGAQQ